MMKKSGIYQEDLADREILIKTSDKTYKFSNPSVQKVVMQGQTTFQISGDYTLEENSFKISIDQDDINTVSEQAGVSKDEARKALEITKGDIAEAIVNLSN